MRERNFLPGFCIIYREITGLRGQSAPFPYIRVFISMYLKSLEIQGFKSFANRIHFQFHNGITAVVGPNGSGKSNVSDAIRWVLGEQSAKSLRGGSMQDVIFAGTQTRKPMSFAYVAITFDNADHLLPVEYDEVTVARRLYRSGESEYLINGTEVRMRDVQELFFDTGIGKEGYSLIGQGQVEKILNGKPDERRELFDEAAGIVKYKHRKAATLKKLQDEEANLVRVNDILSELEHQVGPLKKQSETAKIYLGKRDELKTYDVNVFLINSERSEGQLSESTAKLEGAKAELQETGQKLEEAKVRYEQLDQELEEENASITSLSDQMTSERLSGQQLEGQIDLLSEQIRALEESDAEAKERKERLQQEIRERKAKHSESVSRLTALQDETKKLEAQKQTEEESRGKLDGQIGQISARIEQEKSEIIRLLGERTDIQTGRQRAETMMEQLSLREAQLNSRELTLRSDRKEEDSSRQELEEQRKGAEQQAGDLRLQSQKLNLDLREAQEAFLKGTDQLTAAREEYQRQSARFETLRNMTERYEGYGGSIRRVMEQKERFPGILGVVADLIQTSRKYELAVETALGGSIQNIVTDDESTAKSMIAFLKENKFGRATFLPLTAMRVPDFNQKGALREPGVVGLASELVTYKEEYRALAGHLLGRTVVVDQIDHAIAIARKYHYSLRLVTLDGELLSPGGSMTGGAFRSNSNLLGRRREIDDLSKSLAKRKTALDQLERDVETAHDRRNRLRDQITAITGQIQQSTYDIGTLKLKMQDVDQRIRKTDDAFGEIRAEREEIARQRESLKAQHEESQGSLQQSERSQKEADARIAVLTKQLEELRKQEADGDEKLSKLRVTLAGSSQEQAFITQNQERLKEEIRAREEESRAIQSNLLKSGGSKAQKTARIENLKARIEEGRKKEEELTGQLERLRTSKAEKETKQKSFFSERENLSESQSLLDREVYRLEQQIEKMKADREKDIAYLWEEYELTPVACRELRRDDLGSLAAMKKRIGELRHDIKQLGNVNVGAIDQYRELSERYEFLSGQHEDLVKSASDLQKIIQDLDEGMRTRFKEQFSLIQTEFDRTFRDLFGGGRGTLELEEGVDILDAGIKVIAQPPGKKLQNMMQLSGGEKSLAAIALLFAIQNLKPSPFCLLDEIESALDENNVERYAQYLRKLTKHTQFIIITHRRGSMTAADRLYGITMQEKGVSALVSVDLVADKLDA